MADQKKVEEVIQNQEFLERIAMMEDPEEVQKAFAEEGIAFSLDEVKAIGQMVATGSVDEFSESDLEVVSGGLALATIAGCIACAAALINLGTAIKTGTW